MTVRMAFEMMCLAISQMPIGRTQGFLSRATDLHASGAEEPSGNEGKGVAKVV